MPRDSEAGKKAAETNKRLYGADYYSRIGLKGGKAKYTGKRGFAAIDKDRLREISVAGGISRQRKAKNDGTQP